MLIAIHKSDLHYPSGLQQAKKSVADLEQQAKLLEPQQGQATALPAPQLPTSAGTRPPEHVLVAPPTQNHQPEEDTIVHYTKAKPPSDAPVVLPNPAAQIHHSQVAPLLLPSRRPAQVIPVPQSPSNLSDASHLAPGHDATKRKPLANTNETQRKNTSHAPAKNFKKMVKKVLCIFFETMCCSPQTKPTHTAPMHLPQAGGPSFASNAPHALYALNPAYQQPRHRDERYTNTQQPGHYPSSQARLQPPSAQLTWGFTQQGTAPRPRPAVDSSQMQPYPTHHAASARVPMHSAYNAVLSQRPSAQTPTQLPYDLDLAQGVTPPTKAQMQEGYVTPDEMAAHFRNMGWPM